MRALIYYCDGHGQEVLHYNGIKRIDFNKDYDECVIILNEGYECWMMIHDKEHKPQNYRSDEKGREFLRNHNVSTTPYRHMFTNVFRVVVEE